MGQGQYPGLLGAAEIRRLADAHGIVPTKKLGQNFVHDAGTVRKIVAKAGVRSGDVVLEVGPGLGSLTLALLEAGVYVEAVELDAGLAQALAATVLERSGQWAARLSVTHADATQIGTLSFGRPPSALVANLPYNVAVPILLTAFAEVPTLRSALIMVQKEVADRLVAPKGSKVYGAPTVKLAWYGAASLAGLVGPDVFWPRPNVHSALVRVIAHEQPLGDAELRDATFAVIDTAFEQRRKMLRSSLRSLVPDQEELSRLLEQAQVAPSARPESLEIQDFMRIGEQWLAR